MLKKPLARYVIDKPLASGAIGFYWNVPTLYRKLGCKIPNEPLGTDHTIACGDCPPHSRSTPVGMAG
jgi:hypothetical protein